MEENEPCSGFRPDTPQWMTSQGGGIINGRDSLDEEVEEDPTDVQGGFLWVD